jgi:phospholipase C
MATKIKHVVVLMLENRSFDHMLGYLKTDQYPINGLTGYETNPVNLEPGAKEIGVQPDATWDLHQLSSRIEALSSATVSSHMSRRRSRLRS